VQRKEAVMMRVLGSLVIQAISIPAPVTEILDTPSACSGKRLICYGYQALAGYF
jgi:hypothetical protein